MTLVLETGAGVRLANSYVTAAYVTTYLTTRGRETENSWDSATSAQMDDACVAATDYIEKRFGGKFLGEPRFSFDEVDAEGAVTFSGLPSDTETLSLGDVTYTFVSSLGATDNSVLIGADASATATNLYHAITATAAQDDVLYANVTEANRHATATAPSAAVVALTAAATGTGGNATTLTSAATNVSLTAFSGGADGGDQPLAFPRRYLYTPRTGLEITGIPRKLMEATAEYTSRAHAALLLPDPTTDDAGGQVKRILDQVGPIRTEVEYTDGTYGVQLIKPYPAADKLLRDFITAGAGAIR